MSSRPGSDSSWVARLTDMARRTKRPPSQARVHRSTRNHRCARFRRAANGFYFLAGPHPRSLMPRARGALTAHALAHAAASGCDEAVIVIGHEGARVRAAVEAMPPVIALRFVENRDPTTPNGESLLAAEPCAADRFFLQMVDHLFAEPVLT